MRLKTAADTDDLLRDEARRREKRPGVVVSEMLRAALVGGFIACPDCVPRMVITMENAGGVPGFCPRCARDLKFVPASGAPPAGYRKLQELYAEYGMEAWVSPPTSEERAAAVLAIREAVIEAGP